MNALRRRAPLAWVPSPRHNLPDSDAGRPRPPLELLPQLAFRSVGGGKGCGESRCGPFSSRSRLPNVLSFYRRADGKMSGKREMPVAVNPHRASGTSTSWPFCIPIQWGARSGRKRMSCLLRSSPRSRTYRTGSSRRGDGLLLMEHRECSRKFSGACLSWRAVFEGAVIAELLSHLVSTWS